MILPPGEKIVETKKCSISGQDFFVTEKDLEFYDKVSPVFNGEKFAIPAPTLCPDERMRRRLSWRNEHWLYRRKCDLTGRDIVAMYSIEKPFPVYERKAWWGDDWSPFDFGKTFDFSRSFFDQFKELMQTVPLPATLGTNLENSDFTLHSGDLRDCYLIISTITGEKLLYGYQGNGSKNCVDFYHNGDSEYCYEVVDVHRSYRCFFSQDLEGCRECMFCYACNNCDHCLFCFNCAGKSFCINNKQYLQEEYEKELRKIRLGDQLSALQKRWKEMQGLTFHRALHGVKNENCVGDYLNNCADCFTCFNYSDGEDLRYVATGRRATNCYDCNYCAIDQTQWCLDCLSPFPGNGTAFCAYSWNSATSFYCHYCQGCTDCFGSISLKHAKNAIFNTSYSAQEYETLYGKIIDHMRSTEEWGEFFPHELSPFGYNETVAQEYFPLTEPEVRAKGWNWCHEPVKTFEGNSIQPQGIQNYDEKVIGFEVAQKNIDELLAGVIKCEVTGKPFKIIRQELAFYIENGIPIPTKHPDQRHAERMVLRNPRKLFERNCTECKKDIITTYAPNRPERVVCEECYRKLVY